MTSSAGSTQAKDRGGLYVAVAMTLMNLGTYGYTMLAARILGPQPYGAFGALMATLLVVGVAQLGLQATAARRIAADEQHAVQVREATMWVTLCLGGALGVGLMLCAPLIDSLLRLDSVTASLLVGPTAFAMTLMGGQAGILQGERRWVPLSWVYLANGVPRLLLGTALIAWQPRIEVAMAAVCATQVVPCVVAAFALGARHAVPGQASFAHSRRTVAAEAAHASLMLLAFYALSSLDIVVARNRLDPHDAGLYASGLIVVKAVLFLPQFVMVVAYPSLSTPSRRLRTLLVGLGLVLSMGLLCVLGALVLPEVAMFFAGGAQYDEVRSTLWQFAVLGTLLAVLQLLVYSVLARQSRRTTLVLIGALVLVAVLGGRATSWRGLLHVVTAIDAALAALLFGLSWWRLRGPASTGTLSARPRASSGPGRSRRPAER